MILTREGNGEINNNCHAVQKKETVEVETSGEASSDGCSGGKEKIEDLEQCGPGRAVVEMEQPSSGVDLKASGPGKAVVVMEQPCLGADLEKGTSVPKRRKSDRDRKGAFQNVLENSLQNQISWRGCLQMSR